LLLQVSGNGSLHESWLSQTGNGEKSRQAEPLRVLLQKMC